MKRFLCILLTLLTVTAAFAELNPPHRYFEFGVDADVGLANNWLNMSDFFQETLVLDFTQMASDLKNGFSVDLNADVDAFTNINFGKKFRVGFSAGLDGMGMMNLSQELLQLIAKGNTEGDHSINAAVSMDLSVYLEAGLSLQLFFGKLGVAFAPSMFIPAVYMPPVDVTGTVSFDDDGTITGSATADVSLYSVVSLDDSMSFDFNKLMSDAGLDFAISAEYALLPNLDIGVSLKHIPAVEAALRHEMYFTFTEEIKIDPILDTLFANDEESSTESETTNPEDESDSAFEPKHNELTDNPFMVSRPVELEAVAAFRPLGGDWFDLKGSLGVVFHEPVYVNFGLEAGLHFIKMSRLGGHLIDVSLATGYDERVWTQKLNLGFNLRLLELNLSASSRSTEFAKSFTGSGLGLGVGVKIGF